MMCDPNRGYPFREQMTSRVRPEQIPTDLKEPAMDAGHPAADAGSTGPWEVVGHTADGRGALYTAPAGTTEPPNVRCASLFACVGGWHARGCPLANVDGKHVIYGTCENEGRNHPGHSYGGGRFYCDGDVGVPVEDDDHFIGFAGGYIDGGQVLTAASDGKLYPARIDDDVIGIAAYDAKPDDRIVVRYPPPALLFTAPVGTESDMVNHPAHYGGADDPYEVIKVCEAWGLDRDAFLFNVVKYVGRPGKGDYLEDLRKARFYLNRRIAQMERDQ